MYCAVRRLNSFDILVSQQFHCVDAKSSEGLSIFRYNTTVEQWLKAKRRMKLKNRLMRVHETKALNAICMHKSPFDWNSGDEMKR